MKKQWNRRMLCVVLAFGIAVTAVASGMAAVLGARGEEEQRPSAVHASPNDAASASSSGDTSGAGKTSSSADPAALAAPVLHSNLGDIKYENVDNRLGTNTWNTRLYEYPDGGKFFCGRLTALSPVPVGTVLDSLTLEGEQGTVRFYDTQAKQWSVTPLEEANYKTAIQYYITVGSESIMVCLPQTYIAREYDSREALPDLNGNLNASYDSVEKSWTFSISTAALVTGEMTEYLYIRSAPGKSLIDWSKEDAEDNWALFDMTGDNRWCYNGYYYITPSTYRPTGANYYYRLPSAYLATRCMDETQTDLATTYLGIAMLHVMLNLQNSSGYFPTLAESTWLKTDFNISADFYDTRFNTDFVSGLLTAMERYGITEFRDPVEHYMEFYYWHATNHNIVAALDKAHTGILVQDYWQQGCKPTLSALNHHVAETLLTYRAAEYFNDDTLRSLADNMMRGIGYSEDHWYQQNSNLEYAIMPDGITMAGEDYPYLTYNDLYRLQKWLTEHRTASAGIQRLMDEKKRWMKKNGVNDYLGSQVENATGSALK